MKILLLGANGQVGKELTRHLSSVGELIAFARADLDITDHAAVAQAVADVAPHIIVNAAAYTGVDKAENEQALAYAINAEAVAHLAQCARTAKAWLIHYSTDYVFDGSKSSAYLETDATNPVNVYGASKNAGEEAICEAACQHLIFRTTWVIGKDGHNFAKTMLRLARERDALNVVSDQHGVPTSPSLITSVTIDAVKAIQNNAAWPSGIYHLVPDGTSSWHEVAQTLIGFAASQQVALNAQAADIHPISTADYPTAARRPMNSQLDTGKLSAHLSFDLPHWKDDFLAVARDIIEELKAA